MAQGHTRETPETRSDTTTASPPRRRGSRDGDASAQHRGFQSPATNESKRPLGGSDDRAKSPQGSSNTAKSAYKPRDSRCGANKPGTAHDATTAAAQLQQASWVCWRARIELKARCWAMANERVTWTS